MGCRKGLGWEALLVWEVGVEQKHFWGCFACELGFLRYLIRFGYGIGGQIPVSR